MSKDNLEVLVKIRKGFFCPDTSCPESSNPKELTTYCPGCPYAPVDSTKTSQAGANYLRDVA